jgi:hypothetical protein
MIAAKLKRTIWPLYHDWLLFDSSVLSIARQLKTQELTEACKELA